MNGRRNASPTITLYYNAVGAIRESPLQGYKHLYGKLGKVCRFLFQWKLLANPIDLFRHHEHERDENCHEERVKSDMDMAGDKSEDGRHEGAADVGARHLDADDGVGIFLAEMMRRGVDDGGINRRGADADDDKSRKGGEGLLQGKRDEKDACADDRCADADHIFITNAIGYEAAEKTTRGDAEIKE